MAEVEIKIEEAKDSPRSSSNDVRFLHEIYFNKADDEQYNHVNVVLVGKTGKGKSQMINQVIGGLDNIVGNNSISFTKDAHRYSKDYTATSSGNKRRINFFDMPGFGDSESNDQLFIQKMLEIMTLLSTKKLHYIFYFRTCTDTRYDADVQNQLTTLSEIITTDYMSRVIWINTYYDFYKTIDQKNHHEKLMQEKSLEFYKQFGVKLTYKNVGIGYTSELEGFLRTADYNTVIETDFMNNIKCMEHDKKHLMDYLEELEYDNKEFVSLLRKFLNNSVYRAEIEQLQVLENKYAKKKDSSKKPNKKSECVIL